MFILKIILTLFDEVGGKKIKNREGISLYLEFTQNFFVHDESSTPSWAYYYTQVYDF